jgi:hypothetical protein
MHTDMVSRWDLKIGLFQKNDEEIFGPSGDEFST